MPQPTLIIGLGGTGQHITTRVLKDVLEYYGLESTAKIPQQVQILNIDTSYNNPASVSFVGPQVREAKLVLDPEMQVKIGTDRLGSYLQEIAEGRHPEVARWLDPQDYLVMGEAVYNTMAGANRYRALARLSLFHDLTGRDPQTPNKVRNALTNAIKRIKAVAPDAGITVIIAGSLCGGTGAGLCVDIPYLVKKLRGQTAVRVYGYFVLPGAFSATLNNEDLKQTQATNQRSFAAMREIRRFARELNFAVGYPIHYDDDAVNDPVMNFSQKDKLYDLLYYFDRPVYQTIQNHHNGQNGQTAQPVKVEKGVVPVISEAIMSWVDHTAQAIITDHVVNLSNQVESCVQPGQLNKNAAIAGSVSIYTAQLPVYHLMEGWTYELAWKTLRKLLAVTPPPNQLRWDAPVAGQEDETTRSVGKMRGDWAGGVAGISGAERARSTCRACQDNAAIAGVGLKPLERDHLVSGFLLSENETTRANREQILKDRESSQWTKKVWSRGDWVSLFTPTLTSQDEEICGGFLAPETIDLPGGTFINPRRKAAEVQTSHQMGGGEGKNPGAAAARIEGEVDRYFTKHLGVQVNNPGPRGGTDEVPAGQYPEKLREWTKQQLDHFQTKTLPAWCQQILNEPLDGAPATGTRRHAGKLPHLLELLQELERMLGTTERTLQNIERDKLGRLAALQISEARTEAREAMQRSPNGQREYLRLRQEELKTERLWVEVREARWTAGQMRAYVNATLAELQTWVPRLCVETYQAIWGQYQTIKDNRRALRNDSAVHHIVEDDGVEEARYEFYASGRLLGLAVDAEEDNLDRINWVINPKPTRIQFELNHDDLLALCRQRFAPAYHNENVLTWLMQIYPPNTNPNAEQPSAALAAKIASCLSTQLSAVTPANVRMGYRRANVVAGSVEEQWLVGNLLAEVNKLKAPAGLPNFDELASDDRQRLSFIACYEAYDVDQLTAYGAGDGGNTVKDQYQGLPARPAGGGDFASKITCFAV
ncbi:MAG: tubulin-like doman-containing protein [Bacteroidales bacterium]